MTACDTAELHFNIYPVEELHRRLPSLWVDAKGEPECHRDARNQTPAPWPES